MKTAIKIKKIIILLGDFFALFLSLYITLIVRYKELPSKDLWQSHVWPFLFIFIGFVIVFYITDLYNIHSAVNNLKFIQSTIKSLIIAGLLGTLFFYLNPFIAIAPKTNLVIFIIIFTFIFFIWRRSINWIMKSQMPKKNLGLVGINNQTKELIEELIAKPHLGYNIVFIFDTEINENNYKGIPIVNQINELNEKIKNEKINAIVLTSSSKYSPELKNELFKSLEYKISYYNLLRFYENIIGKIPTEAINQTWFLENLNEGEKRGFDLFKRGFDLFFSIILLAITLVLWPLIAIIIKLESKGPVFFKQIRSGSLGRNFLMIKFRTMKQENNNYAPTEKNDMRITKFGNFLRKSRLDELPQVINILKGEMSFVGPRPERPELIKDLEREIPFYRERMLVKPGATGWDQISGEYHSASAEDTLKKLQYDLFYIKNRSIYLDLSIILKTIATVLNRAGR